MAPPPPQVAGQKRKAGPDVRNDSSLVRKRQKNRNIKSIPSQPAAAALSATGELNIAAFVKAREFEINALDRSMEKAKKGLTTRAFQGVPRSMRRRTASHNAKKVPKRLRIRAGREMKEDNTSTVIARRRAPSRKLRLRMQTVKMIQNWSKKTKTVRQKRKEAKLNKKESDPENHISISRVPGIKKNTLAEAPRATSKFKKRQVRKAWLPTHLWHAKRAHMTKPTEPLWRMAIPLSPTEKSYRPTHRAAGSRGCITWDTSYVSTIGCQAVGLSLENMLKGLSFHGEGWSGAKHKRWRHGTRSAEGWTFERDNDKRPIAPVAVIWCGESGSEPIGKTATATSHKAEDSKEVEMPDVSRKEQTKKKPTISRLMIRIHPSAFHHFWIELLKVAKLQRPQVLIEDLRFEIGSIEVTGPGSTEALLGVLRPTTELETKAVSPVGKTWIALAGLNNPASLPPNCVLSFSVKDPRLHHPPKQIKIPKGDSAAALLTDLMVSWPPDSQSSIGELFSHKGRHTASKALRSQKSINRCKAEASRGQSPPAIESDPKIPVLMMASRLSAGARTAQGSWTVLLPWKCVDPIWRSLLYYPLSSGGVPRFGGLNEKRQTLFEHGQAWFPGDMPGTEAGKAWECTQSEQRFDDWARKPPSRRVAWDAVNLGHGKEGEHGNGWACDWEFMFSDTQPITPDTDIEKTTDQMTTRGTGKAAESPRSKPLTQRQRTSAKYRAHAKEARETEKKARRRNTSSPESEGEKEPAAITSDLMPSTVFTQLASPLATALLKNPLGARIPTQSSLATVRITLLTRGTPNPCARIYRLPSPSRTENPEIRQQWLALDPTPQAIQVQEGSLPPKPNPKASYNPKPRLQKDKLNRHGLPRSHSALPLEDLAHIQYLPPDAHPDVVAQYGPQPPIPASDPTAEERQMLIKKLMDLNTAAEERDKHPPCPGKEDLIGFVTSGAYNLAEGKGTAIGGLWVQRVLEGWKQDIEPGDAKARKGQERERRLCVVRNAGETVGSLAFWEVCE